MLPIYDVTMIIGSTQDDSLKGHEDIAEFIKKRIEFNSKGTYPQVNVDNLTRDFEFMIFQLKKALRELKEYNHYYKP